MYFFNIMSKLFRAMIKYYYELFDIDVKIKIHRDRVLTFENQINETLNFFVEIQNGGSRTPHFIYNNIFLALEYYRDIVDFSDILDPIVKDYYYGQIVDLVEKLEAYENETAKFKIN